MTRTEAIKEFFKKPVLPVAIAGMLYCIFKSACIRNGELDLLWLWILCGLPFGIHRMCVWIVPGGGSLGGGAALFALNFIIGGLIGGFVLVWRLLVAAWYVPLSIYRLINDRGKPAGQSQPAFLIIPILHHGKSPALTSISGPPASGSLPASSWPPAGGSRRPPGPCR